MNGVEEVSIGRFTALNNNNKKKAYIKTKKDQKFHEYPVLPRLSSLYVLTPEVCFQGLGTFSVEFVCSPDVSLIVQRRTHQGDGKVFQAALR